MLLMLFFVFMLSIGAMLPGQDRYYTNLAREDYYTRSSSEPEGFWLGTGAAKLGLRGPVDRETLHALFEGFSPEGVPLVKNAGKMTGKKARQPGWDLTWNLPKSVSILWTCASPGERKRIEKDIQKAVAKMVAHIERELAFCRVGRGGARSVPAKIVVAAFIHATSRAADPSYHVHCVIPNMGWCQDKRVRTIVSKILYENKMLLGSMFRCHVAHFLERDLGLRTYRPRDRNGNRRSWFEVEGVPTALCREFSKRRQAIEKELGARGLETAAAAAEVTLKTRQRKKNLPPRAELLRQWQEVARTFDFTQQKVTALLGRARPRDFTSEYRKALREAVDKITSQESHFTERTLLTEVLNASQGRGLHPERVVRETRERLARDRTFVKLDFEKGQRCYTTQTVLAVEKELLETAQTLHDRRTKPIRERVVQGVIEKRWSPVVQPKKTPVGKVVSAIQNRNKRFSLSSEQAEAVRYLTDGSDRLKIISGLAGTGKTTMLRAARVAFEKQGYRVIGCSTAGVAAKRLFEGSGIESDTVRLRILQLFPRPWQLAKHHVRQLIRAARKKPTYKPTLKIDSKTVLVVDEAGQVGTRDFALLVKAVERGGGLLVAVGDERQLPSIEMGGVFGSMIKRFGGIHLKEITRQRDQSEREAVQRLAKGKGKEVIEEYARQGQLHVAENREKAREELIGQWKTAGGLEKPADHVIFVGTNQEVDAYNDLAQAERLKAGKLKPSKKVELNGETLYVGDRVLFQKKSRRLKVENGDMGTVVGIRRIPMGTNLMVRLDGEKRSRVIPVTRLVGPDYSHLKRGYTYTVHKLQGSTVDHAYAHVGGVTTNIQMAYVAGSRHRKTLRLFTDQNEAGIALTNLARQHTGQSERLEPRPGQNPDFSPLLRQLERSGEKELAHDRLPPENENTQSIQRYRERPLQAR